MISSFQSSIDVMLDPFGECLTPEIAQRIVDIRAPDSLRERVQELAEKSSADGLTDAERQEYEFIDVMNSKLAILQAKARRLLRNPA
jgi:hypothetical protein